MTQKVRSRTYLIWSFYIFVFLVTAMLFLIFFYARLQTRQNTFRSPSGNCSPRSKIVFLKTHKCASTSIQNIFLRYGDEHNLTFVLPPRFNYLGNGANLFHRNQVVQPLQASYNILAHHTRYNRPEMDKIMGSDTVYVTIVRSPVDLLESAYSFFRMRGKTGMDLETMSSNITLMETKLGKKRHASHIGLNQMSFDLGLNYTEFHNQSAIEKFIQSINSDFDLVMVFERMEESLVLLSDLLCWPLKDVIIFKHHVRSANSKTILSRDAVTRIEMVSLADQMLYQFFSAKFEETIQDYGVERMADAVQEFQELSEKWFSSCRKDENNRDIVCQRLKRKELFYTDYIRRKQKPKDNLE